MNPKNFSAVIVDDEPEVIEYLKSLLSKHDKINIDHTFSEPQKAIDFIKTHQPEVLFLDVQMPLKSGFDLVKETVSESYHPHIVFTTAYEEFALKAIKHSALDYLLKPVDEKELTICIEKLYKEETPSFSVKKIENLFSKLNNNKKIKFNTSSGFIVINSDDIIYCQADRNYCEIYLTDERHEVVTCNMNKVHQKLEDNHFFRISRSNVINLNFLTHVERKNHLCYLKENGVKYQLKISSMGLKQLENYLSY